MAKAADRGARFGVALVALAVGSAIGVAATSFLGTSPSDAARSRAAPDLPPPTASVERQQLREVVRGPCEPRRDVIDVMAPEVSAGTPRVVTDVPVEAGDELVTGTPLVVVSGRPVVTFVTDIPFFRDLAVGEEAADVRRLEDALVDAGFLAQSDEVFDDRTAAAMTDVYRRAGVPSWVVGDHGGTFLLSLAQSVEPHTAVLEILVEVGQQVEPEAPLLRVGDQAGGFACSLDSSVRLSVGDSAVLAMATGSVDAAVRSLGEPDPDTGQRRVVVDAPKDAQGLEGSVELQVVADASGGEVLTVPVGGLFTAADGGFEVRRVVSDGYEPVPVELGVVAGGFAEVQADGLKEGDEVYLHASADRSELSSGRTD
jgi:multidrug efflux pump subunit AcrA (membrane-fusion protein)